MPGEFTFIDCRFASNSAEVTAPCRRALPSDFNKI